MDLNCGQESAKKSQDSDNGLEKISNYKNRIKHRHHLNGDLSYLTSEPIGNGFWIKPSEKFLNALKLKTMLDPKREEPSQDISESNQASFGADVGDYYLEKEYGRLGYRLQTGDLNNDKSDDLLISAPIYANQKSYQDGAVFGVLSRNGDPLPISDLNLGNDASIVFKAPKNAKNSRFGHSVVIVDLNLDGFEDVVIGAPSYGLKYKTYEVLNFVDKFLNKSFSFY